MRSVLVRQPPRHHRLVRVSPAPWPFAGASGNRWIERIGRLTLAAALTISLFATALILAPR